MRNLDKAILRKLKESGNYSSLLKLKASTPKLFESQTLYKIYIALKNPEKYCLENEEIKRIVSLEEFLEKKGIKFSF